MSLHLNLCLVRSTVIGGDDERIMRRITHIINYNYLSLYYYYSRVRVCIQQNYKTDYTMYRLSLARSYVISGVLFLFD